MSRHKQLKGLNYLTLTKIKNQLLGTKGDLLKTYQKLRAVQVNLGLPIVYLPCEIEFGDGNDDNDDNGKMIREILTMEYLTEDTVSKLKNFIKAKIQSDKINTCKTPIVIGEYNI